MFNSDDIAEIKRFKKANESINDFINRVEAACKLLEKSTHAAS